MKKHRKPTQHIRKYRSGRWTFVNRGIKYMAKFESKKEQKEIMEMADFFDKKVDKQEQKYINQSKKFEKDKDKEALTNAYLDYENAASESTGFDRALWVLKLTPQQVLRKKQNG